MVANEIEVSGCAAAVAHHRTLSRTAPVSTLRLNRLVGAHHARKAEIMDKDLDKKLLAATIAEKEASAELLKAQARKLNAEAAKLEQENQ